ncbi:hypothetical protein [Flammeovirga sp. EKP202]|uniref:hypothetical protein n=1 Tax=Flammeovirga sp. EKP202 TaxID=2770592 RepID=UPI00165EF1DC|nr:hypothetical protein [Flammeovirga sp. EKP202]MBD0403038.1 hypothetical protein [Flammeovirga sp. EKP202]
MKYKLLLIALIGIFSIHANAQDAALQSTMSESTLLIKNDASAFYHTLKDSAQSRTIQFFIAYDFGEAAFNQFKSLGGEVGVRFKNDHLLRLAYTHLYLSEVHLSSDFAKAVDGENVKGKQLGFELFYDFPVLFKGLSLAPSMGYYDNEYTHTVSHEKLRKSSFTIGGAISFTETDLFKVKGFYYRVSVPIRINLDPIIETKLEDTTIKSNQIDNNIWFFVGFQF